MYYSYSKISVLSMLTIVSALLFFTSIRLSSAEDKTVISLSPGRTTLSQQIDNNLLLKLKSYDIDTLIQKFKEYINQQWYVAEALKSKGAPAVEPLIAALKHEDLNIRRGAAWTLGMIRDPRAIDPLVVIVKAGTKENYTVRMKAAWSLGEMNDERAANTLIDALTDKNIIVVTGAYAFFIRKGIKGSEAILIDALNKEGGSQWAGTEDMANDFLNCGNNLLGEAARTWAKQHHYEIVPRLGDMSVSKWGSEVH